MNEFLRGEPDGRDLPDPRIFRRDKGDGVPGMLLVLRVGRVALRVTMEVLHADLIEPARPGIPRDPASAKRGVERRGQGRVDRHRLAVDRHDDPLKPDVQAAGLPVQPEPLVGRRKPIHAERCDPRRRARVLDNHRVPRMHSPGAIEAETSRSDRDIFISDRHRVGQGRRALCLTRDRDQGTAVRPSRDEHRAVPLASEHDPRRRDPEPARDLMLSREQQHRPP